MTRTIGRTTVELHRWESDEWHGFRAQGIGASEMAAVLSLSPWASPWSLWAAKLGWLPKREPSDKMQFGHRIEPVVADWFTEQTGLHVARPDQGVEMMCANPDRPWLRATPDGIVTEDEPSKTQISFWLETDWEPLGGFEMKYDSQSKRWPRIPLHYQVQGQAQMAVTGWDRVWFAVLHGWRLEVYELERDQADIDFMIERAERFWADHVLTGDPPPVDDTDATAAALAAVYPGRTPEETIELDDDVIGWLDKLAQAKKDQADAKRAGKRASAEIRARIGSYTYATVGGVQVASLKSQTRTTTCQHCGHSETGEPFRVLRPTKGIRT